MTVASDSPLRPTVDQGCSHEGQLREKKTLPTPQEKQQERETSRPQDIPCGEPGGLRAAGCFLARYWYPDPGMRQQSISNSLASLEDSPPGQLKLFMGGTGRLPQGRQLYFLGVPLGQRTILHIRRTPMWSVDGRYESFGHIIGGWEYQCSEQGKPNHRQHQRAWRRLGPRGYHWRACRMVGPPGLSEYKQSRNTYSSLPFLS